MRKIGLLIIAFAILFFIQGCSVKTNHFPQELREVDLEHEFAIIKEDENMYIGRIMFQNSTSYKFIETGVYVQIQVNEISNGDYRSKQTPILLQTKRIDENPSNYAYVVEIPKKVFDVYADDTNQHNIFVLIKGFFIKNDKIILKLEHSYEYRLDTK